MLYTTFETEIVIIEIKLYKGAKRLGGRTGKWAKRLRCERESGRNDPGRNDPGRNDSGRKGKWAKRLRGERESGRNDPDSFNRPYGIVNVQ